jgi:hypothetical protein
MELKSLIYNGPFPEVELALGGPIVLEDPLEDGTSVLHRLVAVKGELCEYIPASIAGSLEEQGDWLLPDGSLPEAAKPREERVFTVKELRTIAKDAGIEVPAKAKKDEIEALIADHAQAGESDPGAPGDTSDNAPGE